MAFAFKQTELGGVLEIVPDKFEDDRGLFSETFNARAFGENGVDIDWVQDNHSRSTRKGVLRGLHFQRPPMAQDKLVRVTKGAILDVAVDIRAGSPTFAKWVGVILSPEKWNQFLVPKGFAHGFVTLEPDTEVLYKVSELYSPEHDAGIRFDDPDVGVDWQLGGTEPVLSQKDQNAPLLKDCHTGFVYSEMKT